MYTITFLGWVAVCFCLFSLLLNYNKTQVLLNKNEENHWVYLSYEDTLLKGKQKGWDPYVLEEAKNNKERIEAKIRENYRGVQRVFKKMNRWIAAAIILSILAVALTISYDDRARKHRERSFISRVALGEYYSYLED